MKGRRLHLRPHRRGGPHRDREADRLRCRLRRSPRRLGRDRRRHDRRRGASGRRRVERRTGFGLHVGARRLRPDRDRHAEAGGRRRIRSSSAGRLRPTAPLSWAGHLRRRTGPADAVTAMRQPSSSPEDLRTYRRRLTSLGRARSRRRQKATLVATVGPCPDAGDVEVIFEKKSASGFEEIGTDSGAGCEATLSPKVKKKTTFRARTENAPRVPRRYVEHRDGEGQALALTARTSAMRFGSTPSASASAVPRSEIIGTSRSSASSQVANAESPTTRRTPLSPSRTRFGGT